MFECHISGLNTLSISFYFSLRHTKETHILFFLYFFIKNILHFFVFFVEKYNPYILVFFALKFISLI